MDELQNYKTVFVVGNGFDLNLGLKTSYKDFMKSHWFSDIKNNFLVDYLRERQSLNLWIDIENELSEYSQRTFLSRISIEGEPKKSDTLRDEYNELCSHLKSYLIEVTKEGCYSSAIGTYVLDHAFKSSPVYILTFNYTYTIENILSDISYNKSEYLINHVHGTLRNGIVFGVEDNAEIDKRHVFLYKSHNPYQKVKGLPYILDNAEKIVFFGYSLGQTDHSYFDDFFRQQSQFGCKEKELIFYHYGQDSYDDIKWQIKVLTNNQQAKLGEYNNISFINIKKEK